MRTITQNILFAALLLASASFLRAADDPRPVIDDSKATVSTAQRPDLPTLYIAGDSTARSDAPLRGWGSELGAFFDSARINVVNRAIGGRSTRTFITDGRWDKILADLKPGDFVLVQFGHNDDGDYRDPKAKGRPSIRGEGDDTAEAIKSDLKTMETIHSFGWYLRKFATDTKAKGATAILLSKVPHKDWKDEKIIRANDQATFVTWTRNAAKATGALFIDTNEIIAAGLERLGPETVQPLYADARTHSSPAGASYNAAAVVVGLKALKPNPLASYFSKLADDLPPTLRAP
jgi:rhamnogalacturonan acetylesterase